MLILVTVVFIILSSYVGASNIKDDSKTGYFVASGIIYAVIIILSLVLGGN